MCKVDHQDEIAVFLMEELYICVLVWGVCVCVCVCVSVYVMCVCVYECECVCVCM